MECTSVNRTEVLLEMRQHKLTHSCLIKCNVYYTKRVNGKFVDTIRHHGCRDISREILSCSLRAAAGVADR